MMSDESKPAANGDQVVGYGNPPKEHQFQKGNKLGKGRKKGAKNLKTVVNEALGMMVSTTVGGKPKKMSKIEAGMHQLANQTSQGKLKAIEKSIALYERYGPQEDPEGPSEEKLKHDFSTLKDYLAMRELIDPDNGEGEND